MEIAIAVSVYTMLYSRSKIYAAARVYRQLVDSWRGGPLDIPKARRVDLATATGLAVAGLLSGVGMARADFLAAASRAAKAATAEVPGWLTIWTRDGLLQSAVLPEPKCPEGSKVTVLIDLAQTRSDLVSRLHAT